MSRVGVLLGLGLLLLLLSTVGCRYADAWRDDLGRVHAVICEHVYRSPEVIINAGYWDGVREGQWFTVDFHEGCLPVIAQAQRVYAHRSYLHLTGRPRSDVTLRGCDVVSTTRPAKE